MSCNRCIGSVPRQWGSVPYRVPGGLDRPAWELAVLLVRPVDAGELRGWSFLACHHPGRGILAQRDDVPAVEPEHPPGERVSHAAVLPGQPLAQVILELPGLRGPGPAAGPAASRGSRTTTAVSAGRSAA